MRCAAGPLLVAARGALWGAARGGIAQKRVARGSGAGRIAGARSAEALKEGRGARGRVHNLDECRAQTCRMSPIRDTRQVCARIRQVCERLACHPARMRCNRPAPEQKSRQRIGFSSMGRIDRAVGSGEPQVNASASRWILRVRPKIRSFGGTFAWHRALTPPRAAFSGPVGAFPGRAGGRGASGLPAGAPEGGPACRGANIKQCMLCIKSRSAMRGCAEGRKALRLMREALLYHRFTSKKWSITKPRHGDTLSGKYLPLIRYLSPLNSKYE